MFLFFAALYVWTALALCAVFRKSGEQLWKAWVPVLNLIVLLELGRLSGWLILLVLIPFAGPLDRVGAPDRRVLPHQPGVRNGAG